MRWLVAWAGESAAIMAVDFGYSLIAGEKILSTVCRTVQEYGTRQHEMQQPSMGFHPKKVMHFWEIKK